MTVSERVAARSGDNFKQENCRYKQLNAAVEGARDSCVDGYLSHDARDMDQLVETLSDSTAKDYVAKGETARHAIVENKPTAEASSLNVLCGKSLCS